MTGKRFDRMALNAAMDLLASGEEAGWLEAAALVVEAGRTVPPKRGIRVDTQTVGDPGGGDDAITGYSPAFGNIEYSERNTATSEVSTSVQYMRIGHYRVYNYEQQDCIVFEHYLESGPFVSFDEPVANGGFAVVYDDAFVPRLLMRIVYIARDPSLYLMTRMYISIISHMAAQWWKRMKDPKAANPQYSYCLRNFVPLYVAMHSTHPSISKGDVLDNGVKVGCIE